MVQIKECVTGVWNAVVRGEGIDNECLKCNGSCEGVDGGLMKNNGPWKGMNDECMTCSRPMRDINSTRAFNAVVLENT